MASPMTHCFLGFLGARSAAMWRLWPLSLFCAALPDIDGVIPRLAARLFHAHLSGMLWSHRGFSHSLFFALLAGTLAALYARKVLRCDRSLPFLGLYFLAITASHGLIDAITNGGEGIMFLAPFYSERYACPFAPVPALRARQWLGAQGVITFGRELLWIWLPVVFGYLGLQLRRRGMKFSCRPFPPMKAGLRTNVDRESLK